MNNLLQKKEILEQIAMLKLTLLAEGVDIDALAIRKKGGTEFNVFNIPDFKGEE